MFIQNERNIDVSAQSLNVTEEKLESADVCLTKPGFRFIGLKLREEHVKSFFL